MKVARIAVEGEVGFAAARDGQGWVRLADLGLDVGDTRELVMRGDQIASALASVGEVPRHDEPEFVSPVARPGKVVAIGLNYLDHIRETKADRPEQPILFAKFPTAVVGPFDDVVMDPALTRQGDYEVELAVVIGRHTRSVPEDEALDAVFGYTVVNDVSARDCQSQDGQFSRSKSFDTFCPIGPWITTADEVPDPQGLALRSWVNGESRQDSSTREMLFPVAYLIHYLARGMTLEPGDVILTGTPHGVGFAMDPPRYLTSGDTVECEVEGLGRLRNNVVAPR